jgi:hypothetical protein
MTAFPSGVVSLVNSRAAMNASATAHSAVLSRLRDRRRRVGPVLSSVTNFNRVASSGVSGLMARNWAAVRSACLASVALTPPSWW